MILKYTQHVVAVVVDAVVVAVVALQFFFATEDTPEKTFTVRYFRTFDHFDHFDIFFITLRTLTVKFFLAKQHITKCKMCLSIPSSVKPCCHNPFMQVFSS